MKIHKKWLKDGVLLLLIILIANLINNYVVSLVKVNGSSMYPYLHNGDYEILNRLDKSYDFGDIIVFKNNNSYLIKRVIGLPGDRVKIFEGKLYINGNQAFEPWYTGKMDRDMEEITVQGGTLFVMGDNRNNSLDSRSESVGLISFKKVLGIIFK